MRLSPLASLWLLPACTPETDKGGLACGEGTHQEDSACVADQDTAVPDDSGEPTGGEDSNAETGGGEETGSGDTGATSDYTVCDDGMAPFSTIQAAIDAGTNPVVVCPGTYAEHLVVTGAVDLTAPGGPSATVLDATGDGTALSALAAELSIEGFTLTGGAGDAGAFHLISSVVALQDVQVELNSGDTAPIVVEGGALTITAATFLANEGGEASVLYGDEADVSLTHVLVDSNDTDTGSGAILIQGGSVSLTNTIFRSSGYSNVYARDAVVTVVNSVFDLGGEPAYGVAGERSDVTVENAIFVGGGADTRQIGVYPAHGEMSVQYSVFQDLWYDACSEDCESPPSGRGNMDVDPAFTQYTRGDYTLSSSSPCIDAGNPASDHNDADGSRNDIGAYGGPGSAW